MMTETIKQRTPPCHSLSHVNAITPLRPLRAPPLSPGAGQMPGTAGRRQDRGSHRASRRARERTLLRPPPARRHETSPRRIRLHTKPLRKARHRSTSERSRPEDVAAGGTQAADPGQAAYEMGGVGRITGGVAAPELNKRNKSADRRPPRAPSPYQTRGDRRTTQAPPSARGKHDAKPRPKLGHTHEETRGKQSNRDPREGSPNDQQTPSGKPKQLPRKRESNDVGASQTTNTHQGPPTATQRPHAPRADRTPNPTPHTASPHQQRGHTAQAPQLGPHQQPVHPTPTQPRRPNPAYARHNAHAHQAGQAPAPPTHRPTSHRATHPKARRPSSPPRQASTQPTAPKPGNPAPDQKPHQRRTDKPAGSLPQPRHGTQATEHQPGPPRPANGPKPQEAHRSSHSGHHEPRAKETRRGQDETAEDKEKPKPPSRTASRRALSGSGTRARDGTGDSADATTATTGTRRPARHAAILGARAA
ncbi:unnamed protein product [Gadus morhua 'NCC']